MRSLKIIAVGKIKQSARYLEAGIALYEKRLARDFKLAWVELPEEHPTPTRPVEQILAREAESIRRHLEPDAYKVLLSERGRLMDSPAFARWLFGGNHPNGGIEGSPGNRMIIVIGGAYGTSSELPAEVDELLSLSPLTFPHQMVRLILLEQLYRATTIHHQEPYHK